VGAGGSEVLMIGSVGGARQDGKGDQLYLEKGRKRGGKGGEKGQRGMCVRRKRSGVQEKEKMIKLQERIPEEKRSLHFRRLKNEQREKKRSAP